jgi:hypothetical protein
MDNVIKKILYSNNHVTLYDQTNKYKYIIRNCAVCGLIRLTQLKDNILNIVSDYIIEKKTFDEEVIKKINIVVDACLFINMSFKKKKIPMINIDSIKEIVQRKLRIKNLLKKKLKNMNSMLPNEVENMIIDYIKF